MRITAGNENSSGATMMIDIRTTTRVFFPVGQDRLFSFPLTRENDSGETQRKEQKIDQRLLIAKLNDHGPCNTRCKYRERKYY
jgi:hypothetical protein